MKVFCVVLVLFALLCSTWALTGAWRDVCEDKKCYGGLMYLCLVNDNEIYGRYSDIGFIIGTVYDDGRVEGVWYEAGYSKQNFGGFEWRLTNNNGDEFTGSWWFGDRKCDRFGWSSTKIAEQTPDFEQCGVIQFDSSPVDIFEGYWVEESGRSDLWLCKDDRARLHGSGRLNGLNINVGGKVFQNGLVQTNSFWREDGLQGVMLVNQFSIDEIIVSWWNVEYASLALGRFLDSSLHSTEIFRRVDFPEDQLSLACLSSQNLGGLGDYHGAWSDTRFGDGNFYVCEDSNIVQGLFSELGWVEANTADDLMFGEIYFSGGREDIDSGVFQIELTNNGHSFEGVYIVNDEEVQWVEDRMDATSEFSNECYPTPISGSVYGQWIYGKRAGDIMSICIENDGTVEMSYTYNGIDQGYAIGFVSGTGSQSIRVTWFEDKTSGIAMYRLQDNGQLQEFFWQNVALSYEIDFQICDDEEVNFEYWGRHSVNSLSRLSNEVNEFSCARNRDLFDIGAFEYSQSDSSDAIVIRNSLMFIVSCVLLVLFI